MNGKKRQGFDFLLGGQLLGGTRIGEQVARYLSAEEVIAVSVASAELLAELGNENEPFRELLERVGIERGFPAGSVALVLLALGLINMVPGPLAAMLERRLSPVTLAIFC